MAAAAGQPPGFHVRLICSGRELQHHELATVIQSEHVHYIVGFELGTPAQRTSTEYVDEWSPLEDSELELVDDRDSRVCLTPAISQVVVSQHSVAHSGNGYCIASQRCFLSFSGCAWVHLQQKTPLKHT